MQSLNHSYKRVRPGLGTFVEITIRLPNAELKSHSSETDFQNLISEAFEELKRLEKIFNFFDPLSELSKFNQNKHGSFLSPELGQVIQFAQKIEAMSFGRFRILNGDKIDLGGIAKGFIVDQLAEFIRNRAQNTSVIVNAGGDIRNLSETAAALELRIPTHHEERRADLLIPPGFAIATSSFLGNQTKVGTTAAKYTVDESAHFATVVVIAQTCMAADALTKVFLFSKPDDDFEVLPLRALGIKQIFTFSIAGDALKSWVDS